METRSTRMRGNRTIIGAMAVIALLAYAGCYFANLYDGGPVVYLGSEPGSTPTSIELVETRRVPRFIANQEISEIVFWPLYTAHAWADPSLLEWDQADQSTWPMWKNEVPKD